MPDIGAQGPLRESSWEAVVLRAIPCPEHRAEYEAGRLIPMDSGCGCLSGEQAFALKHPDLKSTDLGVIARWHKNPLVRLKWWLADTLKRR